MRLCYIGPEQSVHTQRWLRAFVERGHEVHLIALPGADTTMAGVQIHRLSEGEPKLRFAGWVGQTRRILAALRPDILHGHYLTRDGWLAAATLYRPLVLTAWGTDAYVDPARSRLGRIITGLALRRADLVTADAADLRNRLVALGTRRSRVQIVQWGVDTLVFRRDLDTSELRAHLNLGQAPVILSTRGLSPNYNQDVILAALAAIRQAVPETVLLIKYNEYDPDYRSRLATAAATAELEPAVRFVGAAPHNTMASFYALSDVFVSIASSDSTPVSLLEAMACGAAPIVSDLPALREWVVDGQNGFCVPARDAQALSRAAIRLLSARPLVAQFAQTNRRIIQERADSHRQMDQMERLYADLSRVRERKP